MDDFVSSSFLNLIAVELRRQGFEVNANPQFAGKAARSNKVDLLDSALAQLGSAAILKIGAGIHSVTFDPILALLLKAVNVQDLLERWQRLERYMHGQHRVQMIRCTDTSTTLEHYALTGEGPSESEDLVVAGLLAALFQAIGVNRLSVSIGQCNVMFNGKILDDTPRLISTRIWTYSWNKVNQVRSEITPLESDETAADRVTTLLSTDLGRSWRLATVAETLAISTRSLQRRLAQSGSSFQTLLRSTRTEGAAKMLLKSEHGLSEIGYATGFSDQAHFSRDFKLRFNMSPAEYVAVSR